MKGYISALSSRLSLTLLFLVFLIPIQGEVFASEFKALVIPTLMNEKMDGWYKIPPNSGPQIHKASAIYQNQEFLLLVFFGGYSPDENGQLHLTFDVQVFDPKGNPTVDSVSNALGYQGPIGNPKALILNSTYLKIIFTKRYEFGTYTIKVSVHDKKAGNSYVTEKKIELIPVDLANNVLAQKSASEWMMGYYLNPTPIKAINAVQNTIQLENEWLDKNANILAYFQQIFSDNPFLFEVVKDNFDTFTKIDQAKFILIGGLVGSTVLDELAANSKELRGYLEIAKSAQPIGVQGEVDTAQELDILWSEFFATGRYQPIREIISALKLSEHKGILGKIKSKEIDLSEDVNEAAILEATYQSAMWSLTSNGARHPLIFKYGITVFEKEELTSAEKEELAIALSLIQRELNKDSQ